MRTANICLVNQKGGCGKSSCCFHLAGGLAETGSRVLLVDADPQGSLSQAFFGSAAVEGLAPQETLAGLFDDDACPAAAEHLPIASPFAGVFLIPSNHALAPHNTPVPEKTGLKQQVLRAFLDELEGYDVVLIDCPPNLYQCSWNALLAADYVLVPVPPEDFGAQGLRVVHQAIAGARRLNPRLELLGHLVSRSDKRLLVHQAYEKNLRTHYGATVMATVIPEASAFKLALTLRQPVTVYAPRSKAAAAVRALVDEIRLRMTRAAAERSAA